MPLTYSIAYGLIAGIGAYLIMHGTFWILAFIGVPKPVFKNPDDFLIQPEDAFEVEDNVKVEGLDDTRDVNDGGSHPDDEEAGTGSEELTPGNDDVEQALDDEEIQT